MGGSPSNQGTDSPRDCLLFSRLAASLADGREGQEEHDASESEFELNPISC
jgi:hypothetical protein